MNHRVLDPRRTVSSSTLGIQPVAPIESSDPTPFWKRNKLLSTVINLMHSLGLDNIFEYVQDMGHHGTRPVLMEGFQEDTDPT